MDIEQSKTRGADRDGSHHNHTNCLIYTTSVTSAVTMILVSGIFIVVCLIYINIKD